MDIWVTPSFVVAVLANIVLHVFLCTSPRFSLGRIYKSIASYRIQAVSTSQSDAKLFSKENDMLFPYKQMGELLFYYYYCYYYYKYIRIILVNKIM